MFDDMIGDMESNTNLSHFIAELYLRGRKLNISLAFISKHYFKVLKTIRLNTTHYFMMKILNKREHQQKASNHLFGIDYKDVMRF